MQSSTLLQTIEAEAAAAKRAPRIAVFRALQLGDLLCAVPALRALRARLPDAEVTLIGLPWARRFVDRFATYIDRFESFPGFPGLPEQKVSLDDVPGFLNDARKRRWDLVIQMHGCGTITNPLVSLFGGRHQAGYFLSGEYCPEPDHFLPYLEREHEVRRHLALLEYLGAESVGEDLEFPLLGGDLSGAASFLGDGAGRPYVCLHPGARNRMKCWPVRCFAEVAGECLRLGFPVVVTGNVEEQDLFREMKSALGEPWGSRLIDAVTPDLDLPVLAALISRASCLLCNDTGVSHLASALRVPSVTVFTRTDPQIWAPLNGELHRTVVDRVGDRVRQVSDEVRGSLKQRGRKGA